MHSSNHKLLNAFIRKSHITYQQQEGKKRIPSFRNKTGFTADLQPPIYLIFDQIVKG